MNATSTIGLILALAAATAGADFTISPPMMHSAAARGNSGNSVLLYTYSGPDAIVTGGTFGGSISSIIDGTTIAEAQWNLRNTRFGTTGNVSFFHNLGYFANSVLVSGNIGGGMMLKTGDVLRIETHESSSAADDGPGTDAVWNNVTWTFETAVIEDLGNFEAVSRITTLGGEGFGTDTEIAMFNADGVLQRSNDDFEDTLGGGFGGLSLADGTYYLVVTPYDSTFANGLIRPGFWGTGEFNLAFNDVTVDTATLGLYSNLWYKFTIGTPTPCLADFNGDAAVDFFDYLDFVDAFSSGLASADFNGDTVIDFFDYLDFVDAFSTGC